MTEKTTQSAVENSSVVSSDPSSVADTSPTGDIVFSAEDFDLDNDQDDQLDSTEQQDNQKQLFKIKYNGKEEALTLEQMVELAQKGKNYDHVNQEKEALKNSEEMKVLAELAKENGYESTKAFTDAMKQQSLNSKIDKRMADLERQGYDREQAKYVAELELKAQATSQPKAVADNGNKQLEEDFDALLNAYPETKEFTSPEQYPEEFKQMLLNGEKPVVAYSKYLANKADAERKLAEQNAQARQRDTGSFKTGQSDGAQEDFLSGLFGK